MRAVKKIQSVNKINSFSFTIIYENKPFKFFENSKIQLLTIQLEFDKIYSVKIHRKRANNLALVLLQRNAANEQNFPLEKKQLLSV
jgi:hypothetical protein